MGVIANILQIPTMFTKITPTPINTPINRSMTWSKLIYPPHPPITQTTDTPLITNLDSFPPLKYQPQFCYYIDGPFKPPKETTQGHLKREKAGYGIYNPFKNLRIAGWLPRL